MHGYSGILLVPDLMMATTAALSHRQRTVFPWHSWPHTAQAITIERSSLTVMWTSCHIPCHNPWNHFPSDENAPQPIFPDASDVIVTSGETLPSDAIILTPFQSNKNMTHHSRSERKLALRRIWRCSSLATWARSIMRRRNDRPGFTTLVACWRWPISDKSSLFVHDLLPLQLETNTGLFGCHPEHRNGRCNWITTMLCCCARGQWGRMSITTRECPLPNNWTRRSEHPSMLTLSNFVKHHINFALNIMRLMGATLSNQRLQ